MEDVMSVTQLRYLMSKLRGKVMNLAVQAQTPAPPPQGTRGLFIADDGTLRLTTPDGSTEPVGYSADPWVAAAPWTVARLTEDVTIPSITSAQTIVPGLSLDIDDWQAVYEYNLLIIPDPLYRDADADLYFYDIIDDDGFVSINAVYENDYNGAVRIDGSNICVKVSGKIACDDPDEDPSPFPLTVRPAINCSGTITNLPIKAGSFFALRRLA
jgi:hypothetical protein